MLLVAALVGLACFIYGLLSMENNQTRWAQEAGPSRDGLCLSFYSLLISPHKMLPCGSKQYFQSRLPCGASPCQGLYGSCLFVVVLVLISLILTSFILFIVWEFYNACNVSWSNLLLPLQFLLCVPPFSFPVSYVHFKMEPTWCGPHVHAWRTMSWSTWPLRGHIPQENWLSLPQHQPSIVNSSSARGVSHDLSLPIHPRCCLAWSFLGLLCQTVFKNVVWRVCSLDCVGLMPL